MSVRLDTLTDNQLLNLRLCDLPLRIQGSRLQPQIEKLYGELESRNLAFRPHVWLSEEWFTPDGVSGFAIPFYLASSRLIKLERAQMLEVEGGNAAECMRILRHEAGHAINNAFRLHNRKGWVDTFGSFRKPYPGSYRPQPDSQDFVLNLDAWYAQAHPAEDFAETFAVWLKPGWRWRKQYHDWNALKKLEYVDKLMIELSGKRPRRRPKTEVDPLNRLGRTLGEHYRRKRAYYTIDWPSSYDANLYRIFAPKQPHTTGQSAWQFLKRVSADVCRVVAIGSGVHLLTINYILKEMMDRCRELNLRLAVPERQARRLVTVTLTMQTMQVLRTGYHRIPL